MKKFLRIALTICLSFFYVIFLFGCEQKSEMRLRILASSNSEEDQKIKLEVKEIVYNYLKTNNKLNGNTAPNRYNLIKLFSLMLGNTFLQTSIIIAIPPASA